MADLTVRDIAAVIHRHGEPLSAAVERVRYWTDLGIIKAIGPKSPGTGRKRRYPVNAIITAGILQSLVDATGSPAVALRAGMSKLVEFLQVMASDEKMFAPLMLVVGKHPSGKVAERLDLVPPDELGEFILKSSLDIHAVIRVRQKWLMAAAEDELKIKEPVAKRPSKTKR